MSNPKITTILIFEASSIEKLIKIFFDFRRFFCFLRVSRKSWWQFLQKYLLELKLTFFSTELHHQNFNWRAAMREPWAGSWRMLKFRLLSLFLFFAFFSKKLVAIPSKIYARIKAHVLLYKMASSEFWLSRTDCRESWAGSWRGLKIAGYWIVKRNERNVKKLTHLVFAISQRREHGS